MGNRIPRTGMRSSGFRKQGKSRVVEDEAFSVEELEGLRHEVRAGRDGGGR